MEDLTFSAAWAWVLAACSAIVLIGNAAGKIAEAVRAAKAPEAKQDERISKLEGRVSKLEESRDNYADQLEDSIRATRISQEAILALLGNAIDGNNTKEMEKARSNLTAYLINL